MTIIYQHIILRKSSNKLLILAIVLYTYPNIIRVTFLIYFRYCNSTGIISNNYIKTEMSYQERIAGNGITQLRRHLFEIATFLFVYPSRRVLACDLGNVGSMQSDKGALSLTFSIYGPSHKTIIVDIN